jgi:hypothetical protein
VTRGDNVRNSGPEQQCASSVLMIRPTTFYSNPESLSTNAFQRAVQAPRVDTLAAALAEFDAAASALADAGIDVIVAEADATADAPDALFPNNWFSTHADGRIALYPMSVPNRRQERRPALLQSIAAQRELAIHSIVDLSVLEHQSLFVEGTGSLILDRPHRLAYACRSPRTQDAAVEAFCEAFGYRSVIFDAHDEAGRPIYHTNVIMSVGSALAVLASGLIAPGAGLRRVFDALEASGKTLLDLSAEQVNEFAGNILFLEGSAGPVVAISRRALASLSRAQRLLLEQHARPVVCGVETIELLGGGGIRCMLAELFLPYA